MNLPTLFRATHGNQLFAALRSEWDTQMAHHDDAPIEYYEPYMAHAEHIAGEQPQDPRYGVFILSEDDGQGSPTTPYEGLVHVNHKLPNTTANEVRLVWSLVAPRYEIEEYDSAQFARLTSGFLRGAIDLCASEMPAPQLRMFLGNAIDRDHACIVAAMLEERDSSLQASLKGAWLHLTGF